MWIEVCCSINARHRWESASVEPIRRTQRGGSFWLDDSTGRRQLQSPTSTLWFKYKPRGTKWKQTNCAHTLVVSYFWCLPLPSLVVRECVKVDKVCLGLWSGWAEHQTVLPPLHLLHLNTKTIHRYDEEEHWERKHKRKTMIIITQYCNDNGKRITQYSVILAQLYT